MVEVKRREHETAAAMLRRFTRRIQQSGVLMHTRKHKFFVGKPTRRTIRTSALRRISAGRERARLDKLVKLPDEIEKKGGR